MFLAACFYVVGFASGCFILYAWLQSRKDL